MGVWNENPVQKSFESGGVMVVVTLVVVCGVAMFLVAMFLVTVGGHDCSRSRWWCGGVWPSAMVCSA